MVNVERTTRELTPRVTGISLIALAAVMCIVLRWMGRVWWCEAGDLVPWSWDVWSQHNSQHLVDPYSLSHIEHGIGLSVILAWTVGAKTTEATRTIIVALIEAVWEIVENTPMMIARYREATISLDYFGDSILNSLSDYAMCLGGVWIARITTWRIAIAIFIAMELVSTWWIRDSLLLNILMLAWPIDVIKQWQSAGV
tara:strand:+ start:17312 stop:17905 length:594 start_codon:yes stop_codon:yes gene_type:complete